MTQTIDTREATDAFLRRDRSYDGRFVVAVRTTGIYCKPSCPARHTRPEHIALYDRAEQARAAGYRACLRCKPDEVGRDRIAVADAVAAYRSEVLPQLPVRAQPEIRLSDFSQL